MTSTPVVMPVVMTKLTMLALDRLGLFAEQTEPDLILCPLEYAANSGCVLAVMLKAERSWLGLNKQTVVLSIMQIVEAKPPAVLMQDDLQPPTGPHDIRYLQALSSKTVAMAWALAATGGFGECTSLPSRPSSPDWPKASR